MTDRKLAQDGYSRQLLQEGYLRKGGQNPAQSQVQVRPPAPQPLRPAPSSTGSSQAGQQNSSGPVAGGNNT